MDHKTSSLKGNGVEKCCQYDLSFYEVLLRISSKTFSNIILRFRRSTIGTTEHFPPILLMTEGNFGHSVQPCVWKTKELLHPSETVSVTGPSPNWECKKSAPVFFKCPKWSQKLECRWLFHLYGNKLKKVASACTFCSMSQDKWLYNSRGTQLPWQLVVIPREIAPEASACHLIEGFICLGQTS